MEQKPRRYDVMAKVVSQNGTCGAGHEVGQEFLIGRHTPPGICLSAFCNMLTNVRVLQLGGAYPWAADPNAIEVVCPDRNNPVIFEVKRIIPEAS